MIFPWAMTLFNVTSLQNLSYFIGMMLPMVADPMYNGCGSSKICIGSPKGCVARQSCNSFASTFIRDDKYIFEMRSSSKAAYIASALSFDRKMGDDSAMECVNENEEVKIYSSYTVRYDATRDGVPQDIIRLIEGKIDNGRIYCQLERDADTTVNDEKFDLKNDKFYLLLATGSRVKPDKIMSHNLGHAVSSKTINSYV